MKRAISLSILSVFLVISSYPGQQQTLKTNASTPHFRFSSAKNALGIPFDLHGGSLIYFQVRVNGSNQLWFILDTGASSGSFLNVKWVKPLGLEFQECEQDSRVSFGMRKRGPPRATPGDMNSPPKAAPGETVQPGIAEAMQDPGIIALIFLLM